MPVTGRFFIRPFISKVVRSPFEKSADPHAAHSCEAFASLSADGAFSFEKSADPHAAHF